MRSITFPILLSLAFCGCAASEESDPAGQGNDSDGSLEGGGTSKGGSSATLSGAGTSPGSSGAFAAGGKSNPPGGIGSAGSSASAGTTGAGGAGAVSACSVTAVATGTPALIDDFEDGNADVSVADGRLGGWYLATDASGTTSPAVGPAMPAEGGNPGKALHVTGSELTSWGASLSASITPANGCYDASKFAGVTVALKGTGVISVSVLTAGVRAAPEGMRNHYKKQITLSETWTEVSFSFSELGQLGGWGLVVPFDATKIYGIDFGPVQATAPATTSFDFWIDNLTFK